MLKVEGIEGRKPELPTQMQTFNFEMQLGGKVCLGREVASQSAAAGLVEPYSALPTNLIHVFHQQSQKA
jgi:hypothetical protein